MLNRRFSRLKANINWKMLFKVVVAVLISAAILSVGSVVLVNWLVAYTYDPKIFTNINDVPETRVAIVFGAGLAQGETEPSTVLEDRVLAAAELYKAGKVDKILMSGDDSSISHNEPKIMMEAAIAAGVKEFDIQPDYSGDRTYDSCYRAKAVFGINKAILVTQSYHLPRALYTCSSLGIDVIGYSADKHSYSGINDFVTREYLATFLAFWQLNVVQPSVVTGDKVTI